MKTVALPPLACSALACLFFATAGVALAGEPPLRADFEGRSIVAWPSQSGIAVEVDGNAIDLIELASGFYLDSLRGVAGGYLMAGSHQTEEGVHRLFVIEGTVGRASPLPTLPPTHSAIRSQPVLLTEGGRLMGIAWLEGAVQGTLAVRASRWSGTAWLPVETVAKVSGTSQLALAGTVLSDGTWLLVWSRFDGQDDEIVFSSSIGEGWSAVRRVSTDNAVPDIAPALIDCGTGALIAWSRYDGNDYRLVTARYAAGEWLDERTMGEKGSLFPSFSGEGASRKLLYRTSLPRSWTVVEMNTEAKILRHGKVAAPGKSRPVVGESSSGALQLRWPGRDKTNSVVQWIKGAVR